MKRLFRKLKDRKGISMTEVLIAMAVVTIVTGAAISLIVASVRFDHKYNAQTRALNACESAAQCLRFAEEDAALEEYLAHLGFERVEENVYSLPGTDGMVQVRLVDGVWTVTFDDQVIYEYEK